MKIVSAAEMREIDRITEKYGVPSLTLMENAGTAAAQFILKYFATYQNFAVVCGSGNNGGDGFVVVYRLHEAGKHCLTLLLAEPEHVKGDAAEMLRRLPAPPVLIRSAETLEVALRNSDVIIDALLGTGFRPPLKHLYRDAIQVMNAAGRPTVSIDVPSGCDPDAFGDDHSLAVEPNAIVTFTAPKPANVFRFDHKPTTVVPIGTPPKAINSSLGLQWVTSQDYEHLLAPRPPESHKGDFGHVLVVGGSVGKAGAAAMAGAAALRSGAGLVTVATSKSAQPSVAAFMPELMTEPLPETSEGSISVLAIERMSALLTGKTVIAIGPGLARHGETLQLVRTTVSRSDVPVVLDADGINAYVGHASELRNRHCPLILTPHPGEFARLLGITNEQAQKDRIGLARKFVHDHEVILVLKGHRTIVATPDTDVWINSTGNPAMAKGGTGDILTGMIAGMIAQHPNEITTSTIAAVRVHGLCGDFARGRTGDFTMVATDLLTELPKALACDQYLPPELRK